MYDHFEIYITLVVQSKFVSVLMLILKITMGDRQKRKLCWLCSKK